MTYLRSDIHTFDTVYNLKMGVCRHVAYCSDLCPKDVENVITLILKPAHKNSSESTLYNMSQNRLLVCPSPFSVNFEQNIRHNNSEICSDTSILEQRFKEQRKLTVLKMGRKTVLMTKAEEIAMAESKVKRKILSKQWILRRIDSKSMLKLLQNGNSTCSKINRSNTSDKGTSKVKLVTPREVKAEQCYQLGIAVTAMPNEKQHFENPSHPKQNNADKYPIQATDAEANCPSLQMAINAPSMFSRHGDTSAPSGISYDSTSLSTVDAARRQSASQSKDSGAFIAAVPRHADYLTYEKRLSTFQTTKWQVNDKPDKDSFARLGFFYTGRDDLVRCYTCGIGLKDWVKNDDVLKEHLKYSPKCAYLLQQIGKNEIDRIQTDVSTGDSAIASGTQSGTQLPYKVRSPQYQTMEARLASFKTFPRNIEIQHQQLAVAGLYFTGQGDLCRCFTCDGGLKDWSTGDDPCQEHATYFPNCNYISQLKGHDYVRALQQRRHNDQQGANGGIPQTVQEADASMLLPMDRLNLSSDNFKSTVSQVTKMGYSERDVVAAKAELERKGDKHPSVETIVNTILDMQDNTIAAAGGDSEDLQAIAEENERLIKMVQCMLCVDEEPDILFLPCAHHRICNKCAETITHCPICNSCIKDKIRTYRA